MKEISYNEIGNYIGKPVVITFKEHNNEKRTCYAKMVDGKPVLAYNPGNQTIYYTLVKEEPSITLEVEN